MQSFRGIHAKKQRWAGEGKLSQIGNPCHHHPRHFRIEPYDNVRAIWWRRAAEGGSSSPPTGRGQSVKPPFDPLKPTVDIALKDFGGVRSKCPKVPRATRRIGKRVGDGERLLTIGGHLRGPRRAAHHGISLAATMLLDDARTPFGIASRLPWRWLRHHVDPPLGADGGQAKAQELTELLHTRVVLPPSYARPR